jgi:putative MFS transporter
MTAYRDNAPPISPVAQRLDLLPVTRTHRRVVVAVGLGLFFDMYEVFLAGTISGALTKEFGLHGIGVSVLLSSAFLGMFLGAAVIGRITDRVGRRRMFLLSLTWYSVWSLLGAFAPTAGWLIACRFLSGIGVGAEYPVSDTYLSDVLPARFRGRLAAWAYTCSYLAVPALGFLSLALTDRSPLHLAGWRWLLALGALGAVFVLFLRRSLPESPRWLEATGRHREAQDALALFEDAPQLRRQPKIVIVAARTSPGTPSTPVRSTGPLTPRALTRAPYRRRLGMLVVFHLLQTFGYYGFGTLAVIVLTSRGNTVQHSLLYTALAFLGYPLGSLLSIPLIARFERKFLIVGSVLAMAALGLGFAGSVLPALIVACGLAFTAVSNIFSNTYHIYQAEIFPTELRASATGWTYALSRITTGLMPFLLLPLLEARGPGSVFLVVATAMLIVAADIALLGPRTSARSLEEINPR